ncbi:unnamed protein product [Heterosigma akashiwo]
MDAAAAAGSCFSVLLCSRPRTPGGPARFRRRADRVKSTLNAGAVNGRLSSLRGSDTTVLGSRFVVTEERPLILLLLRPERCGTIPGPLVIGLAKEVSGGSSELPSLLAM